MNSYILDAQNFFTGFCNGKDISALNICISEIINNVYDHSRSKFDAYIFSQYYPEINKIKFAISDLGVGIPTTVNEFIKQKGNSPLSDFEAMEWAIQKGRSVKSQKYNIGAGLDTIVNILKGTGNLEIYSGNALLKSHPSGYLRYVKNPIKNFIGTLIEITIDITKLESVDETILDDYTF